MLHKASPQIVHREISAGLLAPSSLLISTLSAFLGWTSPPPSVLPNGKGGTSCLELSLLWEHREVFGCPRRHSGHCENETPSHKV